MAWASSRIFRFSARRPQLSIRSQIMHVQSSQSDWITRAQAVLPAGGFGNFDPSCRHPRGPRSRVRDEDGKEYVDYLIGSGPMILGHGHPEVLEAVLEQLPKGMTFFANNAAGIELAEEICRAVPCAEQVRYVSTGGEADMYAMRLARAFTGRDKIVKFEGGYHGMSAEAQMSLAPDRPCQFSAGRAGFGGHSRGRARRGCWSRPSTMPRWPLADFRACRPDRRHHRRAAAAADPAGPGFLEALRTECDKHGIVLIFDEIVTGFRFAYGGAQELYGVTPDICTLGKIIGGGFALAAIAGRADIMAHFDKAKVGQGGFLMQFGTLSGNPVAAAAGLKTLEILRRPGAYESLRQTGQALMELIRTHLTEAGIAHQIVGDPTLFDVIFSERPVRDYRDVLQADAGRNAAFNKALRGAGVFKSPGKLYPSLAIDDQDLEWTDRAVREAAAEIRLA
jgi:glutamate-1-semialdehyde 2,1-aminomutase